MAQAVTGIKVSPGMIRRKGLLTRRIVNIITWILSIFIIFANLLPWLWMFMSGFKSRPDIMSPNPVWIFRPTLNNFYEVFITKGFLRYFGNSITVALFALLVSLLVGVPAAYAFSRFKITGKGHLFFYVLTTRMAPPITVAVPLYILFSRINLLGTYMGLIIAHTTFTLAFVIWLMKGFFDDIPTEIDEAAMTDGYSRFQAFRKAVLPMVKSGIIATALFAFIFSWNEFLFGLLLASDATRTLPAAFPGLIRPHGTLWGEVTAAGSVVTIPVVILIFVLQRHLVRGLTFGAVKG